MFLPPRLLTDSFHQVSIIFFLFCYFLVSDPDFTFSLGKGEALSWIKGKQRRVPTGFQRDFGVWNLLSIKVNSQGG